ncbi:MAG: type I DNA topoisomerase [Candidatus Nealsonbacteria bacterium]
MPLVIVESPTKSKTISKFLGPKYKVLSSYGHIRDLPKSELGVDTENNFEPKYIVPMKAKKNASLLKKEAEKSDLVILATDEDREGEAIAFHLAFLLGLNGKKQYQRIVFHEITKSAIEEALKNPRKINMALVDAQQARRILDRIVGYKLSPFLWKKVARGLSAGRVQSVAVKLVVEREREVQKFRPEQYWTILALLKKQLKSDKEFETSLIKKEGKLIPKLGIKTEKEAKNILKDLEGAEYKVENIDKKEVKRNPFPPLTTSTLQQESWKKFRFPAKMTMRLAQQLYERGLITYHRTDSFNLSQQSLSAAKDLILKDYGKDYWAGSFRRYKTKSKGAQEAHEAIRPTYPKNTVSSLGKKLNETQLKVYDLIWKRFIASQMKEAIFDTVSVDIAAKDCIFRSNGQTLKFDGFLKVYPIKFEENELPELKENETLDLIKLSESQHFTQPPARYNEASLIKALEENGIGRPSTYAPILSNIQDKNYIEKNEQKRFQPTEIGFLVNDLLVKHFPKIIDAGFTAKMEEDLDRVAEGEEQWVPVIREFYQPFEKNLKLKYEEVSKKDITEKPTEKTCPKCGSPLIIRIGKYGEFYACSAFPKCRYTEPLEKNVLGVKCPRCKTGELVAKRTKRRKIFYGCNTYPKCDFALWDKPTGEICPKCKSLLIKTIREQVKCSDKECSYKLEK